MKEKVAAYNRGLVGRVEMGVRVGLWSEEDVHDVLDRFVDGREGVVPVDLQVRLSRLELTDRQKAQIHDALFHGRGRPDTHRSGKRLGRTVEGVISLGRRKSRRKRW